MDMGRDAFPILQAANLNQDLLVLAAGRHVIGLLVRARRDRHLAARLGERSRAGRQYRKASNRECFHVFSLPKIGRQLGRS